MNFVGSGAGSGHASWSVEDIPRDKLCQPDLHEAMLARLAGQGCDHEFIPY
jgi:hypothetical protein